MAEDAQSNRPDTQTTATESENPPAKTAEKAKVLPEGDSVVRVPGPKPTSTSSVPAGSAWGRGQGTPSPVDSDWISEPMIEEPVLAPARQTETADLSSFADMDAGGADQIENDEDAFLAAFDQPPASSDDAFGIEKKSVEPESMKPATGQGRPSSTLAGTGISDDDDPIAALIAEQEREDAERAAQTHSKSARTIRKSEPEPKTKKPAEATSQLDEDVLSLVRAMSGAQHDGRTESVAKNEDSFSSSPIFGLGSGARKAPARPSSDPLDEIENLIGDAVRLPDDMEQADTGLPEPKSDLDDAAYAAEVAVAAASAAAADKARSNRQGFRPRTNEPDFEPSLDDAIASTRSVEPDIEDAPVRETANNRLIVGAAAAATVLVAVGLGLFWIFGATEPPGDSVPVLASNTVDAKGTPEQSATTNETDQPVIFDELNGTTSTAPADEQIVSRDQSGDVTNEVRPVTTSDTAEEGLANRKVRTVTVRPDGTIVSSDDTVAANEVLPVTRPSVPTLSDTTGDTSVSAGIGTPTASAVASGTDTTAVDPLAAIVDSATQEADASTGELVETAPHPMARPTDLELASAAAAQTPLPLASAASTPSAAGSNENTIDLIAGVANQVASQLPAATTTTTTTPATTTPTTTTATTTTTTPQPTATVTASAPAAAPTDGPDAAAYVQLSSQRDLDAANTTMTEMRQRYQGLFNGAEPFVRKVDLGDRGIYYRVLVPANSLVDANTVCGSVKTAGGDCFVRTD